MRSGRVLRINNVVLQAVALVWCNTASLAQKSVAAPERTLPSPEAEFTQPFTRLMGVRELSDGRLVVSDQTEKVIAIVDIAKQNMIKIGRVGQGPGEYLNPGAVIAWIGDTTLVSDDLGRKFVKVSPAGTIV